MPHVSRLNFGSSNDITSSTATLTLTGEIRPETAVDIGASNGQLNGYQPSDDNYVKQSYDRQTSNLSTADKPNRPRKEQWSWWSIIWSFVGLILCPACIYCTLSALVCNVFAYVDHRAGDYKRKRAKLRLAMWLTTLSILFGAIALIIVLVVLFAVYDAQNW